MSPRKVATAKAANGRAPAARAAAKTAGKPRGSAPKLAAAKTAAPPEGGHASTDVSAQALALAATIERALRDGRSDTLRPDAFQALMAALCKNYGAQIEAGGNFLPIAGHNSVPPTEIMTTTSAILRAANLAVFELGMWQSWTGR
jgi:hypothetical protein